MIRASLGRFGRARRRDQGAVAAPVVDLGPDHDARRGAVAISAKRSPPRLLLGERAPSPASAQPSRPLAPFRTFVAVVAWARVPTGSMSRALACPKPRSAGLLQLPTPRLRQPRRERDVGFGGERGRSASARLRQPRCGRRDRSRDSSRSPLGVRMTRAWGVRYPFMPLTVFDASNGAAHEPGWGDLP
jgi:hypothetical protein